MWVVPGMRSALSATIKRIIGIRFMANIELKRIYTILCFGVILTVLPNHSVSADIYKYRDKNGVLHFSNVPTSSKYRLYMRKKNTARFYIDSTDQYDPIIIDASNRHQVSFSLLKAIIRTESGFDHRAVSKKGALGLMQIMPANIKALDINDPFNPRENIMGGARYFKQLYKRFNGNLDLALAAYNAGPKAVERHKKIPPYRETRAYVKKVLRYYQQYQQG